MRLLDFGAGVSFPFVERSCAYFFGFICLVNFSQNLVGESKICDKLAIFLRHFLFLRKKLLNPRGIVLTLLLCGALVCARFCEFSNHKKRIKNGISQTSQCRISRRRLRRVHRPTPPKSDFLRWHAPRRCRCSPPRSEDRDERSRKLAVPHQGL